MSGHIPGQPGSDYSGAEFLKYGTAECQQFRERIFSSHLPFLNALKKEYKTTADSSSYVEANQRLLNLHNALHVEDFYFVWDEAEVREFSRSRAVVCLSFSSKFSEEVAFKKCSDLAISYRLNPPDPSNHSNNITSCLNRLCCEKWWKRNLMRLKKSSVESVSRDLKLVHDHATPYCSTISLREYKTQKLANRQYLESQLATNERGQEYTLAELSDLGVSNPAIRRLELITRCKGYEVLAKEMGHEALFVTFTAPSRFHRMTKITGESGKVIKVVPNGKFDGSTPRDAQEYLCSTWAKIQAKFHREGIRPYGFRVAEPHHDGTPHWHFLLFVQKERSEELVSIFHRWALKDSPDEKGAAQHRVKVEKIKSGINPETGREYSATGYIIKYISKNIDGHGIDNDEQAAKDKDWNGKNPYETAERIEAWARTNRIRQFQPIGGPSVTVWRELRRLSEQEGVIEQVRQAADAGDWAAFVKAMGGPNIPRNEYLARPTYALSEKLDFATGEITEVTHTRYGDEAKERVVGILIHGITVLSRTHFWQIRENEKVIKARQKIMDGIADILEEIQEQNHQLPVSLHSVYMQQAQPAALDLFQ
ncbi:replication endonuclease [Thalassolituus sp. ST750PaO-4]|uniref:replication endonuclease n=1 Tax=Thalassolituus sp. ST750PaO-4 TaxID=2742965 RepID=UPI001CE2DB34|nr:replication endonuclease [Thalassolituus sp. ST750PaO-4]MCA6061681.1 replication endonuclease [Thalassolituus sp. ST750PaO-4]